jgi:plasmid stabilization system protein ParE
MPRILKRPEAESDLDEIWLYIAQDNPQNADKFLDHIHEKIMGWALRVLEAGSLEEVFAISIGKSISANIG